MLKKKKKILLQDKSTLTEEPGLCKARRPDGAVNGRDVQRHLGDEPPLLWHAWRGAGRVGSTQRARGLPCLGDPLGLIMAAQSRGKNEKNKARKKNKASKQCVAWQHVLLEGHSRCQRKPSPPTPPRQEPPSVATPGQQSTSDVVCAGRKGRSSRIGSLPASLPSWGQQKASAGGEESWCPLGAARQTPCRRNPRLLPSPRPPFYSGDPTALGSGL